MHHFGKYQIESKQDYIEYLHGKILWEADEVSAEAHNEAVKYLRRVHTVDELEGYLAGLDVALEKAQEARQEAGASLCERLRKVLETIHLGRAWCDRCESYDHACGCSPDVNERRRQEALASIGPCS